MTGVLPLAIFIGVFALVVVLAHSTIGTMNARGARFLERFSLRLDVAGVAIKPEGLATIASIGGMGFWVLIAIVFRPGFLIGALILPLCIAAVCCALYAYISVRMHRRRELFLTQLETAMRLLASGLRIGLSLRLAMNMLTEELHDPVRHEFARVIGQTNIGISPYDALDGLAERMPSNETLMLAKVIRIQSQTGGNLSAILEHLATTIKERRRIARKINALTAEGRIGALVLEALPIGVGGFIIATQRDMAVPLLTTGLGHGILGGVLVLEFLAIVSLNRLLQVRA